MKKIITLFLFCALGSGIYAQDITVNGECISGPIVLQNMGPIINGRDAFQGYGSVAGYTNINVVINWLVPQNAWVLTFSGQAYFVNYCNTLMPPATGGTTCVWQSVPGAPCDGGAALSINGLGTLPIHLKQFTAIQKGNAVQLNWASSNETNNKGFEIDKSADGKTWIHIGFISGNNTSDLEHNYLYLDEKPLDGINLYRLKQIDLDGKYTYSNIIEFDYSNQKNVTIFGDGKGILHLEMPSNNEKLVVNISDFSGRELFSKTTTSGNQIIDISAFPPGIYLLRIKSKNRVITKKLFKS